MSLKKDDREVLNSSFVSFVDTIVFVLHYFKKE